MSVIRRGNRIACSDRRLSIRAKNLFPRHFREQKSELIILMEAYYRWMEQQGGVQRDIYCLLDNKVSSKADPEFLNILADQFLSCLPGNVSIDRRFLIQHIVELYRSKGTEEGIKLFFRLIYGEEPEIMYPNEFILRASDGIWVKNSQMKITYNGDSYLDLLGNKIFGEMSGAYATVESAYQEYSGANFVTVLELSGVVGTFFDDEIVRTLETEQQLSGRIVGTAQIVQIYDGGEGYTQGEVIPLMSTGDGVDFQAIIETVDINGSIEQIRITNTGSGYIEFPPIPDIAQMSGTNANFQFFIGAVSPSLGHFVTERGLLSGSQRLQDGEIYQQFSYIIKSDTPISEYLDALKCTVHPAGFLVSGIYVPTPTNPDDIAGVPVLFHLDQPDELNTKNPDHPSSSKFVEPVIWNMKDNMKAWDFINAYGWGGEGGDNIQFVEYYLDRVVEEFADVTHPEILVPGINAFEFRRIWSELAIIERPPGFEFMDGTQIELVGGGNLDLMSG